MTKKRINNFKPGKIVTKAFSLAMDKMANVIVVAVFVISAVLLTRAFLYRSDYFRLKDVEIRDNFLDRRGADALRGKILNMCGGTSIFKIDPGRLTSVVSVDYPDAKNISVSRSLPDKIVVSMKFRRPVAVVRGARSYFIDGDGFVLTGVRESISKYLPAIVGVKISFDEKNNAQRASANLKVALALLRELKTSGFSKDHVIKVIDVSDLHNTSFYLKNDIEIKIGNEKFEERIDLLKKTLGDPRLAPERIKYIDVRFNDVVIGPR